MSIVSKILRGSADLFDSKNQDYADAYILATDVINLLVPDKSVLKTRFQQIVYHNMYAIICKLCRAASLHFYAKTTNNESVLDTWKDISVYSAMIAGQCGEEQQNED